MELGKCRKWVQCLWAVLTNGYIQGLNGHLYKGWLKHFCVPGMNCYACPLAFGSCPIGALQALLTQRKKEIPFYVIGFLFLIGFSVGRFICGWLCLFGLIQELLYRIPIKKLNIPKKQDNLLRKLKYLILFVFVILLPTILREEYGIGVPYFCKYICPVGTLEGGIPFYILDEGIRAAAHWLFVWKFVILIIVMVLCTIIYRPFCKYICPLGAVYSFFQKVSLLKMTVNNDKCLHCNKCSQICKMNINPINDVNSLECIRCGDCIEGCPAKAISFKIERSIK